MADQTDTPLETGTQNPAEMGEWSDVFPLPNAAIHAHLLPNGKVLFWGRRDLPSGTLDDQFCTPHVWNPGAPTPQPNRKDGTTVNLFCAGHSILPDGTPLVVGGHFQGRHGRSIRQASTISRQTSGRRCQ